MSLNVYSGSLAGSVPATISLSGNSERPYSVNGNTFLTFSDACQRSCALQYDDCQKTVNANSSLGTITQCDTQQTECNSVCVANPPGTATTTTAAAAAATSRAAAAAATSTVSPSSAAQQQVSTAAGSSRTSTLPGTAASTGTLSSSSASNTKSASLAVIAISTTATGDRQKASASGTSTTTAKVSSTETQISGLTDSSSSQDSFNIAVVIAVVLTVIVIGFLCLMFCIWRRHFGRRARSRIHVMSTDSSKLSTPSSKPPSLAYMRSREQLYKNRDGPTPSSTHILQPALSPDTRSVSPQPSPNVSPELAHSISDNSVAATHGSSDIWAFQVEPPSMPALTTHDHTNSSGSGSGRKNWRSMSKSRSRSRGHLTNFPGMHVTNVGGANVQETPSTAGPSFAAMVNFGGGAGQRSQSS